MALQRVLSVLVGAPDLEVDQPLAVLLALAGDLATHGDDVAHPGDRGEARAELAHLVAWRVAGDQPAEEGHRQHAVGEDVLEAKLLGEVQVDMDRIVIARAAAIERELVTADRRQDQRLERVADLDLIEFGSGYLRSGSHDLLPHFLAASGWRTTVMPVPLATSLPAWSFIAVSWTTNHSAPPFLSYMSTTFCWQVTLSPTWTGAR